MFTALSERLTAALKRLTGRGVLSEQDVTEALREIRRHLLEADVSFEVTTGFVERVRERAIGALAVKTVSPGQQVVKLVHDEIAAQLGGTTRGLDFASVGPTVILLVGLQGSGKTSTAAKLARRLKLEQKAPGLVAADPYRPAADRRGADGRAQGAACGDEPARGAARGGRDDGAGRRSDRARLSGGRRVDRRDPDEARRRRAWRGGALDSWRDGRADQVHRHRGEAGGARAVQPRAGGGPDPGPGRHRGVGREGGCHHGCRGDAASRAKGALETGDGSRGLSRRAEADAGDGTDQTGARSAAGRERAGAQGGQRRRPAFEARRGDRPLDDAGRAGRSLGAHRIAAVADREGRGAYRTGSQPAAGAVPADAEAFEKDVGTLWQLAFDCGAWGGRGRAISGSSSRIRARPATGGSS